MTTVVNNPGGGTTERVVESSSGAGWAVAVIILLAIVAIGGFVWVRYYGVPGAAAPATNSGGTNINVTLPPATPDSGGTPPAANPAQ